MSDLNVLADPASPIDLRIAAARALGEAKDPATLDALAAAMDVTDEGLRDAAKAALAAMDAARAFEKRLENAGAPGASRRIAARALRHLKEPRTVPALAHGLADADVELRRECAHALAVFGAADAVEALQRSLADTSSAVRWFAATALGAAGKQAVPALKARLAIETDPTVKDEISRQLQRR